MARCILSLLLLIGLSGCAGQLNNDWLHNLAGLEDKPGSFSFDWQLSGDSSLLPLQVFDNGKKVWLQYPVGVVVPAMFSRSEDGDILLSPVREEGYLVLKTVPEKIIVRGGLQQAEIQKKSNSMSLSDDSISADLVSQTVQLPDLSSDPVGQPVSVREQVENTLGINNKRIVPGSAVKVAGPKTRSNQLAAVKTINKPDISNAAATVTSIPKLSREYAVSPKDINIRRALKSWSKGSNWTFEDEHWSVDVDIPIAGSASFGNSFRVAVRDLLAATELGDRPLQPCFYANKVLRVVPLAQRCDRTTVAGASL